MPFSSSTPVAPPADPWLYVEELEHRVANEYASIIAFISMAAGRSESAQAREALMWAADRLLDCAEAHRALQVPSLGGTLDLAHYLRKLCNVLANTNLAEQGVRLTFVEQTISLEARRCWQVGLIISELVANAARHAFRGRGGSIVVEMSLAGSDVQCRVIDDGRAVPHPQAGSGSRIVETIAGELHGKIEKTFGLHGTTATLSFPLDSDAAAPIAFAPRARWLRDEA